MMEVHCILKRNSAYYEIAFLYKSCIIEKEILKKGEQKNGKQ